MALNAQAESGTAPESPQPMEDAVCYLDTNEIAQMLKFKPRKVREMCQTGELPAVLIGGEYRVERRSLRAYLEKQRVQPAQSE